MASQNPEHYGRACESSFSMHRRAQSNRELFPKRQATGSILSTLMLVCSINRGLIRQAVRLPLQGSIQASLYTSGLMQTKSEYVQQLIGVNICWFEREKADCCSFLVTEGCFPHAGMIAVYHRKLGATRFKQKENSSIMGKKATT